MRIHLVGFILLAVLLYQCSFNKMFMYPQTLTMENFRKQFYDPALKDTFHLVTDTALNPIFTDKYGNTYTFPFKVKNVYFKNTEGETLQGWKFMADSKTANGIHILFLHGNAGSILSHFTIIKPLVENGCNVFIFDYSGFGISEGKAERKNLPDDAEAALNYFIGDDDFKSGKKIIYGQSLGGHLTLEVAKENQDKIDGVVVEGAFTNHDEIGAAAFKPGFIAKMMIREFYNGKKNITQIKKPIMVIHSINDETIPFFMGEKLFQLANEPKTFYQLEKCHVCGPIHYTDSIIAKIQRMVK